MKLVGALIAMVGALFWAWPRPLGRFLIHCGLIESEGLAGLRDAYRVLSALPWITLFGVLLFVGGHIAGARHRPELRRRPRHTRSTIDRPTASRRKE